MSLSSYQIKYKRPTVDAFIALRASIGWGKTDKNLAKVSLANSLFHVTVYRENEQEQLNELIGMGRVVGDGAMYFYLQDVVVAPDCQGQGIGELVMKELEIYLANTASKGATIGLLSAKGKENFYRRFGYLTRPNDSLGNGMCKFVR